MTTIRLHREVLKWGNAYGIRITKKEAHRLGVKERSPVDLEIRTEEPRFDPKRFRFVDLGKDASRRHNEIASEGADAGR